MTFWGEIGVLTPPLFCAAPKITVTAFVPIMTVPITGEGGKPPPTKGLPRVPPQFPLTPMAPDAVFRFNV